MKMMSSTSMTSTSGTTLISARLVATRRPRRACPASGMGATFGIAIKSQGIHDDERANPSLDLIDLPVGTRTHLESSLSEVPLGDVQELEGEVIHFGRVLFHFRREVVVEVDRRNRRKEAGGGGDEC